MALANIETMRSFRASDDLAQTVLRQFVPIFPRVPCVYDWNEPVEHPKGVFIARPEPYEWFDPAVGRAVPKQSPDQGSVTLTWRRAYVIHPPLSSS